MTTPAIVVHEGGGLSSTRGAIGGLSSLSEAEIESQAEAVCDMMTEFVIYYNSAFAGDADSEYIASIRAIPTIPIPNTTAFAAIAARCLADQMQAATRQVFN